MSELWVGIYRNALSDNLQLEHGKCQNVTLYNVMLHTIKISSCIILQIIIMQHCDKFYAL